MPPLPISLIPPPPPPNHLILLHLILILIMIATMLASIIALSQSHHPNLSSHTIVHHSPDSWLTTSPKSRTRSNSAPHTSPTLLSQSTSPPFRLPRRHFHLPHRRLLPSRLMIGMTSWRFWGRLIPRLISILSRRGMSGRRRGIYLWRCLFHPKSVFDLWVSQHPPITENRSQWTLILLITFFYNNLFLIPEIN